MRTEGYYWVKEDGHWIIAQYSANLWWISEFDYKDGHFEEIDERRIERGHNDIIELLLKTAKESKPPDIISSNPYLCNDE